MTTMMIITRKGSSCDALQLEVARRFRAGHSWLFFCQISTAHVHKEVIIIIIINEFHRDASLKQNFRAAVCHVLH